MPKCNLHNVSLVYKNKFEEFGKFSDDIGAFTPWSEGMGNDKVWSKVINNGEYFAGYTKDLKVIAKTLSWPT